MSQMEDAGESAGTRHVPVMMAEVLNFLAPAAGQTIVDGTVGGGGHAREIAQRLGPAGTLIALDRDPRAIEQTTGLFEGPRVHCVEANFADIRAILDELRLDRVHGVLLDLGVSSDQIADASRGFSFKQSGPLDMRLGPGSESARTLVNRLPAEELADIFYRYGEERYSRRVARAIVEARRDHPIETTEQLAELVRHAIPRGRGPQRIDPATRVFQALRIAVNDELSSLEMALDSLPACLEPDGRAVVISFHSLEDRIVKNAFRSEPWDRLTRKPVTPGEMEIESNPRARSAKLRAARLRRL